MESTHPLRFVVLHHTGFGEDHYDLMFERDDRTALLTFRIRNWPIRSREVATPLGDHRAEYLDYEGLIGGGRGQVVRVSRGTYRKMPDKSPQSEAWSYVLHEPDHESEHLRLLLRDGIHAFEPVETA